MKLVFYLLNKFDLILKFVAEYRLIDKSFMTMKVTEVLIISVRKTPKKILSMLKKYFRCP